MSDNSIAALRGVIAKPGSGGREAALTGSSLGVTFACTMADAAVLAKDQQRYVSFGSFTALLWLEFRRAPELETFYPVLFTRTSGMTIRGSQFMRHIRDFDESDWDGQSFVLTGLLHPVPLLFRNEHADGFEEVNPLFTINDLGILPIEPRATSSTGNVFPQSAAVASFCGIVDRTTFRLDKARAGFTPEQDRCYAFVKLGTFIQPAIQGHNAPVRGTYPFHVLVFFPLEMPGFRARLAGLPDGSSDYLRENASIAIATGQIVGYLEPELLSHYPNDNRALNVLVIVPQTWYFSPGAAAPSGSGGSTSNESRYAKASSGGIVINSPFKKRKQPASQDLSPAAPRMAPASREAGPSSSSSVPSNRLEDRSVTPPSAVQPVTPPQHGITPSSFDEQEWDAVAGAGSDPAVDADSLPVSAETEDQEPAADSEGRVKRLGSGAQSNTKKRAAGSGRKAKGLA